MTKFNQALIAGASSIALFAGALALITPAANAYTTCNTIGSQTFCNGSYTGRSYSGSCNTIGTSTYCN